MKIAFIGLGIMGKPMAKNLLKAGHELTVYDNNADAINELVDSGATGSESSTEAAKGKEVIVTMLPNSPHVKAALLGEGGAVEGAEKGATVIDMSSIAPLASREIAYELAKLGVNYLDAPVSGGEPKAVEGTLAVMVGGDKTLFDKYESVISAMASSVTYVGEVGAGNVTKLANQVIVALNIAAMSEALVLAKKAGVDPRSVYQAIRGGLAGSTVLDAKAPMVLERNFEPGFRIDLHIKDLCNAMDTSHGVGSQLPLTSQVLEMMYSLREDGHGSCDHDALALYYEKLTNTQIAE
ncbi:2-hydroxy-3-oxopropionate reductase [Vibrio sp. CAIM 722]|uniref:2-hydroxy-3-oxopropionate reductase n=1 Tax=Vibrio eleionomae TaxID=2653505 RepID=A0A7X4LMY0_9VIBR|nr:2-hydroxy-3-oxopropionate reductase [Vibrio eleionomae]MZI94950.1 2-hydroxy-3-oxopropionate reductase [Vibrio eleionomae]